MWQIVAETSWEIAMSRKIKGVKGLPYIVWKIRVETIDRKSDRSGYTPESGFACRHTVGESFRVEGERIYLDKCEFVSQYALATLLPHLPVRQRPIQENDWVGKDTDPSPEFQTRILADIIR